MTAKASSQSQPSSRLRPEEEWISVQEALPLSQHHKLRLLPEANRATWRLWMVCAMGGGCRQPNPGVKLALTHDLCSPPLRHSQSQPLHLSSLHRGEVFHWHLPTSFSKTYPSLISSLAFLHFRWKKRHWWFNTENNNPGDRVEEGWAFHQSESSDLVACERMGVCSSVWNVFLLR